MIDIIDNLIELAQSSGTVTLYRTFPQKDLKGKTYGTITPTIHMPRLMESGEEVMADLSYNVQLFGSSPKELDTITANLSALYGKHNITLNGITHGYSPEYRRYTVLISYSAVVDRRGCVYIG